MKPAGNLLATPRKTGRPLSFERRIALEKAMLTFWRYGYEATSIVDLTTAMGVTAPSLYCAFGDKKRLFLESARLYAGDPEALAQTLAAAPTAYDAVHAMMVTAVITYTGDATPPGCLLASATASVSSAASDVQAAITDLRRSIGDQVRNRIARDIASGQLPASADAAALAGFVMTITQGMSVLARDGVSRHSLLTIVEVAMAAWPQV